MVSMVVGLRRIRVRMGVVKRGFHGGVWRTGRWLGTVV